MAVVKFLLVLSLLTSQLFAADIWSNFRPETVKTYGCSIKQIQLVAPGMSESQWSAEAWAKHSDPPEDWSFALLYAPVNDSGFKKAMKECETWQIEARKHVDAAQNPKAKKHK